MFLNCLSMLLILEAEGQMSRFRHKTFSRGMWRRGMSGFFEGACGEGVCQDFLEGACAEWVC